MCGINGALSYRGNNPVSEPEILRVRDAMSARGPDNAGFWTNQEGSIAFGHRRLSIIDLSPDGNQPMASKDGRYHIVFNGEIYNYQSLRDCLSAKGHVFRTSSDTEVILTLFASEGVATFNKLRGMFSLAIWDELEKSLMVARGPMGIKPLYYADDGYTFRFASQVKALLAGGGIDTSAEPAGHAGYFLWGHIPEPFTLFKGIRQVPAGSYLTISENGVNGPHHYHDPKSWFQGHDISSGSAYLHDALRDSVNHHFVSDVPVSLFLSAGRDSATLLALASETAHNPVHAVTLGFEEYTGTADDECPIAAELARRYGASHIVQQVSSGQFRDEVDGLLLAMDQPTVDGANTYFVCKVAASMGIRVALSGLGADEIFGGYPSFSQVPKLARTLRWTNVAPGLMRGVRKAASALHTGKSPKYAGLFEYGGSLEGAFLLRRGLFMPWEIPDIIDRELAFQGLEDLAIVDRLKAVTSGLPTDHAKVAMMELYWYMQNRLLRDSDWASMAHSLELRVPFVDVELMNRLGPWIASQHPPTKAEMAASPKLALPQEVLSRPKTGFNIPVADWAMNLDPAAPKEHSLRQWAKYVYRHQSGGTYLTG